VAALPNPTKVDAIFPWSIFRVQMKVQSDEEGLPTGLTALKQALLLPVMLDESITS
jgi:hypothetical protein